MNGGGSGRRLSDGSMLNILTHCSLETPKRVLANIADPDQTPQNAEFDQGLHCLKIVQPYLNHIAWHT